MHTKLLSASMVGLVIIALLLLTRSVVAQTPPLESDDLTEMSLEQLINIEISSSGSLTKTTRRKTPATITTITAEDIQRSGARNLMDLLDIYVPNFEWIFHSAKMRHMGLRGIISDRDDKYLLLVNGRVMNEKTDFGVETERDLPMLTDIHHIDVVPGPGSALYGPGALAMVINIVTDNARTFTGLETTARVGAIEEFYSGEIKFGKQWDDDQGIFLYLGSALTPGAQIEDSPVVPGRSATIFGKNYDYNDRIEDFLQPYNGSFRDRPKWKFHGEYTNGGFDFWTRYTSGGSYDMHEIRQTAGTWWLREGEGYRQATFYAGYDQEISDELSIRYVTSYDITMIETEPVAYRLKSFREEEWYGRIMASWKPVENHSFAFGGEWSYELFGRKHTGFPDKALQYTMSGDRRDFKDATAMPEWETNLKSLLAEYQWTIDDQWTTFVGGRLDQHDFTGTMKSPRAAVVYTPTEKDTIKVMGTRSVRTNTAAEMKLNHDQNNSDSKAEKLDAVELRYERQESPELRLAGDFFYHWHDIIAWANGGPHVQGTMRTYGFELEAGYHKDNTRIEFSHGYTKLVELALEDGITHSELTAEPFGYGNDLANWSNHVTKLMVQQDLTSEWSLDSSLLVYWGYPGGKDFAEYQESTGPGRYEPDFNDPFDHSVFLNLGVGYKPKENLEIRLDGYNILGWFQDDINKRRIGFNNNFPGSYRILPASIGVSLKYRY